MAILSTRLQLPIDNFIGPRTPGTIKAIAPGVFQDFDDRFPTIISEMVVSYENSILFYENEAVTV